MSRTVREAAAQPLDPRRKGALVLEVLGAYGVARWALHRHGAPAAAKRLRGGAEPWSGVPSHEAVAATRTGLRLGSAVQRTLRFMPADSRCLVRSLVLVLLLARRGIGGTLVIGVRPDPAFRAHAWVEYAGRPLLPAGDYARLTEI